MSERAEFGQIATAAFIASMIGATLVVVAIILFTSVQAKSGAQVNTAILFALFGFPFGWVAAAFIAWPVGTVIGWLVSLTGPSTAAKAAAGGGLTGFVLIATVVLLGSNFPWDAGPEEWLYLAGFTALGAVSGWLAYRLVLKPRADP